MTAIDSRATDSSVIASFFYTLDENGNRVGIDKHLPINSTLSVRNETASYTHNRLNSAGTTSFSHDDEGQLTTKVDSGTTSYIFDDAHRLREISGSSTTQYFYDGAGNRLRALRDGVETRYIYDSGGNLLAEADSTNVINRYYIHGMGLLAAITPTDETYCYHHDGLGSTATITDMGQNVVNAYAYAPFGSIINETEFFSQPFKYVGKLGVMTEESGLYYMRARYYDPISSRFISEDPLGFDGGDVNLYVYGGNNPVLMVDPEGTIVITGSIALGFAAVKIIGFGVAYVGTKIAMQRAQAFGNRPSDSDVNMAFGGVAAIQSAQIAAVAGGEAAFAGGQMTMNMARSNPRVIKNAYDFVSNANPSITPSVTSRAGLLGWATGQAGTAFIGSSNGK